MLAAILEPLKVNERTVIVMPVNNNPDVSAAGGGSHW